MWILRLEQWCHSGTLRRASRSSLVSSRPIFSSRASRILAAPHKHRGHRIFITKQSPLVGVAERSILIVSRPALALHDATHISDVLFAAPAAPNRVLSISREFINSHAVNLFSFNFSALCLFSLFYTKPLQNFAPSHKVHLVAWLQMHWSAFALRMLRRVRFMGPFFALRGYDSIGRPAEDKYLSNHRKARTRQWDTRNHYKWGKKMENITVENRLNNKNHQKRYKVYNSGHALGTSRTTSFLTSALRFDK